MGLESQIQRTTQTTPAVVSLAATTAARLTTSRTSAFRGIVVTADPANTAAIYFGTDADVTNTAKWFAVALPAYGPILIPVTDASGLYAYTTGSSHKFGWAAV